MKGIRKANVRESNNILILYIVYYMYVIRKMVFFSEFEVCLNWFNNILS